MNLKQCLNTVHDLLDFAYIAFTLVTLIKTIYFFSSKIHSRVGKWLTFTWYHLTKRSFDVWYPKIVAVVLYQIGLFVCLFVCLEVIVPLENFSLIWRHLLIHRSTLYNGHLHDIHTRCRVFGSGDVTTCFYDLGLSRPGIEPRSPACEENALLLRHGDNYQIGITV